MRPMDKSTSCVTLVQTPGPGTYRVPSEFGIYAAQDKYVKEFERADQRKASVASAAHHKNKSQSTERSTKTAAKIANNVAQP